MLQLRPYQEEVVFDLKYKLDTSCSSFLVNASVGAGKSLIIAETLLYCKRKGMKVLCLTMSSSLIRQNAATFRNQGGDFGIYCSALRQKDIHEAVIFASPFSVRNDIKKNGPLSKESFHLIVIDEAHNVNISCKKTSYMRIFNHFWHTAQENNIDIKFIGLTGTPFRGKGHTIVGPNQFFQEEVCSIEADWLIQKGYLTEPKWGYCDENRTYDFSRVPIMKTGKFHQGALQNVIDKEPTLTFKIMKEVTEIVKKRNGAFIFASSVEHCKQCLEALPQSLSAMITGDTGDKERECIINRAKNGKIKFIVNVNVLTTGIDIPNFDTIVFVRPTESLVLYIQCLGRGLRLSENKKECLILDYAGNLDRHGDIDNPLINKALQQIRDQDPNYCISCTDCGTINKVSARRCIGKAGKIRCSHFFKWKECGACDAINDLSARFCRVCKFEMIDPNQSLSELAASPNRIKLPLEKVRFTVSVHERGQYVGSSRVVITYFLKSHVGLFTQIKYIKESFSLTSDEKRRIFYETIYKDAFFKIDAPIETATDSGFLKKQIKTEQYRVPSHIECIETNAGIRILKHLYEEPVDLCRVERKVDVKYMDTSFDDTQMKVFIEFICMDKGKVILVKDSYKFRGGISSINRFYTNFKSSLLGKERPLDFDYIKANDRSLKAPKHLIISDFSKNPKYCLEEQLVHSHSLSMNAIGRYTDKVFIPLKYEFIGASKNRIGIVGLLKEDMESICDFTCLMSPADIDLIKSGSIEAYTITKAGRWDADIAYWILKDGVKQPKDTHGILY